MSECRPPAAQRRAVQGREPLRFVPSLGPDGSEHVEADGSRLLMTEELRDRIETEVSQCRLRYAEQARPLQARRAERFLPAFERARAERDQQLRGIQPAFERARAEQARFEAELMERARRTMFGIKDRPEGDYPPPDTYPAIAAAARRFVQVVRAHSATDGALDRDPGQLEIATALAELDTALNPSRLDDEECDYCISGPNPPPAALGAFKILGAVQRIKNECGLGNLAQRFYANHGQFREVQIDRISPDDCVVLERGCALIDSDSSPATQCGIPSGPPTLTNPPPAGGAPDARQLETADLPKGAPPDDTIDFNAIVDALLRARQTGASKLVRFMADKGSAEWRDVAKECCRVITETAVDSLAQRTNNVLATLEEPMAKSAQRLKFLFRDYRVVRDIGPA